MPARFQLPDTSFGFEGEDLKPSATHVVGSAIPILVEFNSTSFDHGAETTP